MPGLVEAAPSVNGLVDLADLNLMTNHSKSSAITGRSVTFGDMHGNALKMLCCLELAGVIKLTDEQHAQAAAIYNQADNCIKLDFSNFEAILKSATINTEKFIRFAGDTLADRGKNDYLTLLIYKVLAEKGVDFEVIFSNHDLEFLQGYKRGDFSKTRVREEVACSMAGLKRSIDTGMVDQAQVSQIIENVYLPRLKLVSAEKTRDGIIFDTHAPSTPAALDRVCLQYGIDLSAGLSIEDKIEKINHHFTTVVLRGPLDEHFAIDEDHVSGPELNRGAAPHYLADSMLVGAYWLQKGDLDSFKRTAKTENCSVRNRHGHTGPGGLKVFRGNGGGPATEDEKQHFICLDTNWGKFEGAEIDTLQVFNNAMMPRIEIVNNAIKKMVFGDSEQDHLNLVKEDLRYLNIVLRVEQDTHRVLSGLVGNPEKLKAAKKYSEEFKSKFLIAVYDHIKNPSGDSAAKIDSAMTELDMVLMKDSNKIGREVLSGLATFVSVLLIIPTLGASLIPMAVHYKRTGDVGFFRRPRSSERLHESVKSMLQPIRCN